MAGTCECGNETSGSIKCGEFLDCKPVSFLRRTLLHGVQCSIVLYMYGCIISGAENFHLILMSK